MQIWYLSPFLLAILVWWVATRKYPEEKEKWAWLALGISFGAVIMFTLVFLSQPTAQRPAGVDESSNHDADAPPRVVLEGDSSVEILPPTRLRQDRARTVGSLQITLLDATQTTANVQVEPFDELEFFSTVRMWTYASGANSSNPRTVPEIVLGRYVEFGYKHRLYRLALLQTDLPLRGFMSEETVGILSRHAVVRLLDVGPYSTISTPNGPGVSGGGPGISDGPVGSKPAVEAPVTKR